MIDSSLWDIPAPFTSTVTVGPGDIDGLGHSNNGSYVSWCESCAWSHSAKLGLTIKDYQQLDHAVAIHEAKYNYFLPTFSGDQLLIGTWLTDCDKKLRLQRQFQIINTDTAETVLRAQWNLISVSLRSGKATKMRPEFVRIYGAAVTKNPAK